MKEEALLAETRAPVNSCPMTATGGISYHIPEKQKGSDYPRTITMIKFAQRASYKVRGKSVCAILYLNAIFDKNDRKIANKLSKTLSSHSAPSMDRNDNEEQQQEPQGAVGNSSEQQTDDEQAQGPSIDWSTVQIPPRQNTDDDSTVCFSHKYRWRSARGCRVGAGICTIRLENFVNLLC